MAFQKANSTIKKKKLRSRDNKGDCEWVMRLTAGGHGEPIQQDLVIEFHRELRIAKILLFFFFVNNMH